MIGAWFTLKTKHLFAQKRISNQHKRQDSNPNNRKYFDIDFEQTHENPIKSPLSHNPKITKFTPKLPSNQLKSSIPSNDHQINQKSNIHTEINTTINLKTQTKPLQTPNISC